MSIVAGTATQKLTNTPAAIFSYPCQSRWFIFKPQENNCVGVLFFNERLRHRRFILDIAKLLRTPFLQEHFETPNSVFIRYICNYSIIKFNANKPNWREDVLKTSWSRRCKTSWRRLENVLKMYNQGEYICLYQDVLKTSSEDVWLRRIYWSWSRRLENVLKTSSEDKDERRL